MNKTAIGLSCSTLPRTKKGYCCPQLYIAVLFIRLFFSMAKALALSRINVLAESNQRERSYRNAFVRTIFVVARGLTLDP